MSTRRSVIAGIGASLMDGAGWVPSLAGSRNVLAPSVRVHEITMAAPDIICVEVHDGAIARKGIVTANSTGDYGTFSVIYGSERAAPVGPVNGDHDSAKVKHALRLADVPPTAYLNRGDADHAGGYGSIGDHTVVGVFRKTVPHDSGRWRGDSGAVAHAISMKHYIYLRLSGHLSHGNHVITAPNDCFPQAAFKFDENTRCISIRNTQLGMRPGDGLKLGYLALWLPGGPGEGAVEFLTRYGLTNFEVVNSTGGVEFAGKIKLRVGPTTEEANDGVEGTGVRYASLNRVPMAIEHITQSNPARVIYAGQDPFNGDLIRIDNVIGMGQVNDKQFTVADVDVASKSFALSDIDSSTFKPYESGGIIYATHLSNRAGTYVYGMDYSAWKPQKEGQCRLRIPGLGVSDPFLVSDAAWYLSAKKSIGGLYAHRSGIDIDGRFGYARPADFRRSKNGQIIYKTELPFCFSSENGGPVSFGKGADPAWITDTEIDCWGGYHDAGDWDRRVVPLTTAITALLDTFEVLPPESRKISFGIPKSSDCLDTAIYAGSENVPDIVHEAIWSTDIWRRLQESDGSVSGGVECSSSPKFMEPSWLNRMVTFSYHPDHVSTFAYAAQAARLSMTLSDLGQVGLAEMYKESAIAAWNWATKIYENEDERNSHFSGTKANLGAANYDKALKAIQKQARDFRNTAAGHLYRLTGDHEAYGKIVVQAWPYDLYGAKSSGAWAYFRSKHLNKSRFVSDDISQAFTRRADIYIVAYSEGQIAYRNLQYQNLNLWGFGTQGGDLSDVAGSLIRAHVIAEELRPGSGSKYLETLMAGRQHNDGANQVGLSFMTGQGTRWPLRPLNENANSASVRTPDGITIYGWVSAQIGGSMVWGDSFINALPEFCPDNVDHSNERRVEPYRFAMPTYEYLIEHPLMIPSQEYTVQQCIIPAFFSALYLWGWDGNTKVE